MWTSIRKISTLLLLIGLVWFKVNAQDINFTMFNYSPLFLNPANTGNYNGNWRLAGNFRNQWSAASNPYRTASLSFDTKFNIFKQKFGAGLLFLNDESGAGGLSFNKIYASIGYEKEINKNYFNMGFQFGYVFGSINDWNTWDNTTGSFTAPNGEENFGEKVTYADLNAGLCWRKNIGIFEPEAGIAFLHINTPNNSFFENEDEEQIKSVLHSKVKIKFNDRIYLLPAVYYMGNKSSSLTILGTNIGYNFVGNISRVKQIFGGIYIRNGIFNNIDSFSALLGTSIGMLDIAFSYDINISTLSESAGKMGAYEISFIYRNISTLFNTYSIPCERY